MNKTTAFDLEYSKQILDSKRPWERGCRCSMARDADLTDVEEPARPVGGVTTRSGRHPPDRLISDSVWAQVRSVLRSWLGD